ncbi:GTP cyclohydrolase MptA [Candidatus Hakubella thermalkaliphila]|uniref:GTP cyclohydrolase IV n=1 Tax=Candidatus Hakubella thermalkaliphila TaxID=2754717 RepID=A0A6V8P7I6_9ACTN|nr:GTP cyclohydrolase MptA [Candidatus Hakubella thermalkaliphila]GFP26736.1 GTP cyclohydrolase IV [Candidatus Hakubella thermalkaliphila]
MERQNDIQQTIPGVHVSLSRVGITGAEKFIRIRYKGKENIFYSEMELYVDLSPKQMGVHMSRFSDVVNEVVDEIVRQEALDIESLAEKVSRRVLEKQRAVRSEVNIRAKCLVEKQTPVSHQSTQEIYNLIGIAVSTEEKTKKLIGVEAWGMNTCPCAQEMVRTNSRERLLAHGFSEEETEKVLGLIPMASHNQRGKGSLLIGADGKIRAEDLVGIVEASMSSEIYDLLKRPDELYVVEKAHSRPRFVEDSVREMLSMVLERYPNLPGDAFVLAKQENYEGIHSYDVFAERYGTVEEIRKEIQGRAHVTRHTSIREWLDW